jgi:hypothetical protein
VCARALAGGVVEAFSVPGGWSRAGSCFENDSPDSGSPFDSSPSMRPLQGARSHWPAFPGLRPPWRTPSGATFACSLRERRATGRPRFHGWFENDSPDSGSPFGSSPSVRPYRAQDLMGLRSPDCVRRGGLHPGLLSPAPYGSGEQLASPIFMPGCESKDHGQLLSFGYPPVSGASYLGACGERGRGVGSAESRVLKSRLSRLRKKALWGRNEPPNGFSRG